MTSSNAAEIFNLTWKMLAEEKFSRSGNFSFLLPGKSALKLERQSAVQCVSESRQFKLLLCLNFVQNLSAFFQHPVAFQDL